MIRVVVDAFRRSPRRFIVMLLDMSSVNPLTIYQIAIAAFNPTLTSVAMIPIVAIIGHLAINIRVMIRLGIGAIHVVNGCLAKGVKGATLQVSEVLASRYSNGAETYQDLERWLVQFNGLLKRKLDDMVALHYAPGSGVFTTYTHSQFYSSHVFISALPVSSSPVQRFFFLHEIFHSLMYIATRPVALIAALPAHLCLACWMFYTLPWSKEVLAPIFALAVTMFAWHERTRWSARRLRVTSEIVADAGAVIYLEDSDLRRLSKSRILASLADKELTSLENAMRRSALQEHIQMALDGQRDELIARSSEELAITAPRFIECLFICAVVLLAAYADPPTATHLWVSGSLLLAALCTFAVAVLFYVGANGRLAAAIEEQFPEGNATDALRANPMSEHTAQATSQ